MKPLAILITATMLAGALSPAYARVEAYGARRYTQVGHYRGDYRGPVVDRHGSGWGGAIASGLLGVAAAAVGSALAPSPVIVPPPVVVAPPMGEMVPALPAGCITTPAYNGSVVYNCGGIFYQPVYEGYSLMYQVVPAP